MTRLSSGPALRALPVAAMLFLAAACAPSDRSGEANPDAPVVRNEGAGAWAPGQEWRLGETARIGADGEGNGVELGNIVGVALDPMGRVWVADAQAFAVHVFDSAGKHVRTLGRKGGGPGEYSQLAGMAWGPDGKLWVQDAGNARFTVYDTAGRVVATHPRESSVSMIPWPGGYDREGRLYDVASVRRPGGAASLPRAGGTEPGLVRMSGTMEPTDSFRLPEFKGRYFEITSSAAGSRSVSRIDVPFAPTQIWHLDAGGHVWTATTDRYRLVQHAFDGDTVRVVERAYQPVAVSSEDIDRVLEGYSAFTRQGGRIDRSLIPRTKPALADFFVDPDGYLWVLPFRRPDAPRAIDVFDPRGRFLGTLPTGTLIVGSPQPAMRGNRMAAATFSPDGVPQVVVFRIDKDAAASRN
jgi:hypothetical protein